MPLILLAAMLMPTPVPQNSSAFFALAAHHCVTGGHSHVGVVHAVGAVGAKVDILQTKLFQMCLDSLFQFKFRRGRRQVQWVFAMEKRPFL